MSISTAANDYLVFDGVFALFRRRLKSDLRRRKDDGRHVEG
jgi:hypothetical protein